MFRRSEAGNYFLTSSHEGAGTLTSSFGSRGGRGTITMGSGRIARNGSGLSTFRSGIAHTFGAVRPP